MPVLLLQPSFFSIKRVSNQQLWKCFYRWKKTFFFTVLGRNIIMTALGIPFLQRKRALFQLLLSWMNHTHLHTWKILHLLPMHYSVCLLQLSTKYNKISARLRDLLKFWWLIIFCVSFADENNGNGVSLSERTALPGHTEVSSFTHFCFFCCCCVISYSQRC